MARLAGIDLPKNKRGEIGLTYIYGIGRTKSNNIIAMAKVNPDTRVKDLKEDEVNQLRDLIEKKNKVEGDLRREIASNIKRLKDIKSFRGTRHQKGLPSRGQRTKTNSRTTRGNVRKTMGSGRRKLEKK